MSDGTEKTLGEWRQRIDAELERVSSRHDVPPVLGEAIHYSLTGEGKRLRGLLLMAAYDALHGKGDASVLAAAIEIVHAYSLVHDDLPCMDDDNIRRGRPTTHRAFDVATATIAGVVMVPIAVQQTLLAAETLRLNASTTSRLVSILMHASGASGMVGGQLRDLDGEGQALSAADLEAVHRGKTGALIEAACRMGALAAGGDDSAVDALASVGASLGLSFQIADDVLDATASSESLGKTARRDQALAKSTYASLLGVGPARAKSEALVSDAMSRLAQAGLQTPLLQRLAHFVSARRS